ncbi:hypothetical protein ACC691_38570, partial [Rhizobium johnstonii]|uniref:hypothetical protein n=1 Tax=Rhizobium johnstonii TaxID=3019933 RepID=UPI003F99B906
MKAMGEVADYVAGLDAETGEVIAELYERARAIVPESTEGRSYGMAALRYRDKPLFSAMASK